MTPLAEAIIILAAKYGPTLVSKIIEVASKPKPTREDWSAVFAEAAKLDYNEEIKAAQKRAE
jgi:hypothetical protein